MRASCFALTVAFATALVAAPVLATGPSTAKSSLHLGALNKQIQQLYRSGKYTEAVALAERYVALVRKRYGEQGAEFATAIAWLGILYVAQGRYPEAELLYNRALALREKAQGPNHPHVAITLNNLALLYSNQGRYAEAEKLYNRALTIVGKAQGRIQPNWVGISLNNLALLYKSQGRYADAEPLFKRSLALVEKAQGPNHPHVATSLNNLAALYQDQGRYAEAEPLLQRALVIREKALPAGNPEIALTRAQLALLYRGERFQTKFEAEAKTQALCEAGTGRVWAQIPNYGTMSQCIAYYLSRGSKGGKLAVLFFDGDVLDTKAQDQAEMNDYLTKVRRTLDLLAQKSGMDFIFIARPGVFGSSGNHGDRRRQAEFLVLNRAVDIIKQRHGYERLVLAGQSGGASVVAALLTLGRTDVVCAVPASGSYDAVDEYVRTIEKKTGQILERTEMLSMYARTKLYDVMQNIANISKATDRRLIVIGDARDTIAPFEQQRRFAERVRDAGHHVLLVQADGSGEEHHGLSPLALKVAGQCALGNTDDEIQRSIKEIPSQIGSTTAKPSPSPAGPVGAAVPSECDDIEVTIGASERCIKP
jgi:tetratricopeptide (TPR) repeat protein